MKEIDNNKSFEDIKHIDENGFEFWYARELILILQYSNWQNFEKIIDKAKISCENSSISVFGHFIDINKLSKRANNAEVEIKDYKLTCYACYLIAQNGDSRKKVIALAQTYFAVQTRKQEITENNSQRAQELNGCFAINCGDGVIQSEAERDLAKYLFCADFDGEGIRNAISGRIAAAKAAGISINEL